MLMRKNDMLYLNAPEDAVAAVMWIDPPVLSPRCRVNEAIERIRQVGLPDAGLNSCFVVSEEGVLLGLVGLRTLLLTRGGVRLETVMTHPFATLQPEDDREVVRPAGAAGGGCRQPSGGGRHRRGCHDGAPGGGHGGHGGHGRHDPLGGAVF